MPDDLPVVHRVGGAFSIETKQCGVASDVERFLEALKGLIGAQSIQQADPDST